MFDLDRAFNKTEEFLRRHIKSKAVREAEKRREKRQMQEALRRMTRAAGVVGASGAGMAAYAAAIAPIGATGLTVAGGAAVAAAATSLFWPSRRRLRERRSISSAELDALMLDAEEWLLGERAHLPARALASLDGVLTHMDDLRPHLAGINPNGTLAWEVRRLMGEHLPRLIQAWRGQPASVRETEDSRRRLIAGLETVIEELARLCLAASDERLLSFETQERFLEARYRAGGLGGE